MKLDISHDGLQLMSDHSAQLLHRELKAAVADKEDGPSTTPKLFGSHRCTLRRSHAISDAAPEDLAQRGDPLRETSLPDAKVRRTGLGDDDISRLQPLTDAGPEPGLADDLIVGDVFLWRGGPRCEASGPLARSTGSYPADQ